MLTEFSPDNRRRGTVLLFPTAVRAQANVAADLAGEFHVLEFQNMPPEPSAVWSAAASVQAELEERRAKRVTVFGAGRGASLAQAVALTAARVVGRLVLVDPTCRSAPSRLERAIDFLESHLPFGLPFRALSADFDSRSFLQRIYCPTLVALSAGASPFVAEQGREIASRIPNSWLGNLVAGGELELLRNFLEVPTKRPQKNLPAR